MAFDEQKIIALLELLDGPRDKDFIVAAFPDASSADIDGALVSLGLAGSIELGADGIKLKSGAGEQREFESSPLSGQQLEDGLRGLHPRFYTGLGHLPDEPIIGVEPSMGESSEVGDSVLKEDPSVAMDIPEELWVAPIEMLNLREPVVRNLNRSHIHSIQELVDRSEADLMALRGMGLKKVNEVMEALAEIGLSLSMKPLAPDTSFFTTQTKADAMSNMIASRLSDKPRELAPMSLDEWLSGLKDSHRQAMELRLAGKKLQQVGDAMGITRERVRQMQDKVLKARPPMVADSYRYLFDAYDLSEDAFCSITDEEAKTYYYLKLTSENKRHDRKPLHEMLDDEFVSDEHKAALRETGADPNAIYLDGERIEKSKHAVVAYVLKHNFAGGPVSLESLFDAYVDFLQAHRLEGEKRLDPTNRRAFYVLLERNPEMLVTPSDESGEKGVARIFDTSVDFIPLQEAIAQFADRNMECTAAWLMEQQSVAPEAKAVDVRSGTELHVVLNRYCEDIPGVTMGRLPMITLGSANRDDQVLGLIKEMSPATIRQLAEEYEHRYGVSASTFMGSYLKDFKTFLRDGEYVYEEVLLTPEQSAFISGELERNGGYMPLMSLREEATRRFPELSFAALNKETIAQAGGRVSGNLVITDGLDIGSVFQKFIDDNEYINAMTPGAGPEVLTNLEFQSELNKALRRLAVVEYDDGSYLSTRILSEIPHPVYPEDMRDFLDSAIAFMERGVPYTLKSLRSAGFDHKLFELEQWLPVKDKFYESILMQGYVGGALKRTPFDGVTFFCRKDGWFSIVDVLEYVLAQEGSMQISELQENLLDVYGLDMERAKLILALRRTGLTWDKATDVVSVRES